MSNGKIPITGMERGSVKLDMQEQLAGECKTKFGTACITGDSELFYIKTDSPECAGAGLVIGDSSDAVYMPKVYAAVCESPGNCRFDPAKPLGSVCMADRDIMKTVRSTLGVQEASQPSTENAQEVRSSSKDAKLVERSKDEAREVAKNVFASLENNVYFSELSKADQNNILTFIVKEAKRGVAKEMISSDVLDMIDKALIESLKQQGKELRN